VGARKFCAVGEFRRVWLWPNYVVKIPRLGCLLRGIQCNLWEAEMWHVWRVKFKWGKLCPVTYVGPWGIFLIMERAERSVTLDEIKESDPDYYPDINVEYEKPENWGRLHERIVAIDYGLWGSEQTQQREFLISKPGPAWSLRQPGVSDV
jgi:hypothetical protein